MVGYGAMMAESLVAIMATVAACVLQPGIYFAINSPAGVVGQTAEAAAATISSWDFTVTAADMQAFAQAVGEQTHLQPHRWRAGIRRRHGAHFFQFARRARTHGALVPLRHHV